MSNMGGKSGEGMKMIHKEALKQYDEIMDVFISYLKVIPKAYKSIDKKNYDEKTREQLHRVIINRLHWQVWSFCDSIIKLNTYKKYAEENLLLRYTFETTLLIQYLHENPYEAKRWLEFQNLSVAINAYTKKDYFKYKDMDYYDFINYLKKMKYNEIIPKIRKNNYRGAKIFSAEYLRKNVNHNKFFSDATNDKLTKGASEFYSIMSKYAHPSIAIVENYIERDVEYELDILKAALNFFDVTNKIFLEECREFISEETTEEMNLHILMLIKIFDINLYNKLKELTLPYPDNSS